MEKNNKSSQIVRSIIVAIIFLIGLLTGKFVNFPGNENFPESSNDNLHLVTEVIDGDTIEIDGSNKVRLLGVDTPERGECYYPESKAALQKGK